MVEEVKTAIDRLEEQFSESECTFSQGNLFIEDKRGFNGHSVSDSTSNYYESVHNYSVDYK